jgi:hypothetical protein
MELKEKRRIIEKWGDNCESITAYDCYSKAKALLLSSYPIDGEALKRLIKKQNAITDKFAKE